MGIIEKHCPECGPGTPLVVRVNKQTQEPFIGCSRFPACGYTEPTPESVKMRLSGMPTLPGLE